MRSAGNPPARPFNAPAVLGGIRADLAARFDLSGWLGRVAVLLLSGFHAWLFWSHVVDGRLLEPAVATRWLLGVLLTAGFIGLRRTGLSLIRGRKAIVLWLLVALLHAHAVWSPQGTIADPIQVDEVVVSLVAQAASATMLLGIGLVLLVIVLRQRATTAPAAAWFDRHATPIGSPAAGWLLIRSPRPPPLS